MFVWRRAGSDGIRLLYDHRACGSPRSPVQEVPTVVLPLARLVPLAIVTVSSVTGSAGVIFGAQGGLQIMKAKKEIGLHTARYEKRHALHLAQVNRTNVALQTFGRTQERAERHVIVRMEDFLRRHGKQVLANERLILDGVDGSNRQVPGMVKLNLHAKSLVVGGFGSVFAATAAPAALRTAVTQYGKASTGTLIKILHGAAEENAILAVLGGGTVALGGGGKELGAKMLNVAMVGPGLFVVGLTVKTEKSKAQSVAENHRSDVDKAIGQLDMHDEVLRGVRIWAYEQNGVVSRLVSQATDALDLLESEPFDMERHGKRLQSALLFVTSVGQVAFAPAVQEGGDPDGNAERLTFKYRDTTTEATDDLSEKPTRGKAAASEGHQGGGGENQWD